MSINLWYTLQKGTALLWQTLWNLFKRVEDIVRCVTHHSQSRDSPLKATTNSEFFSSERTPVDMLKKQMAASPKWNF